MVHGIVKRKFLDMHTNKSPSIFIAMLLTLILAACSGSAKRPGSDLLGKWIISPNEAGSNGYAFDLTFHEDGTLTVHGFSPAVMEYVVIAPGRLKLSEGDQFEIIQFSREDEDLTLVVGGGTNHYTRDNSAISAATQEDSSEQPTSQAANETVTETIPEITATSIPLPPSPTATPKTDNPTAAQPSTISSSSVRDADGMPMMYIPASSFLMGSREDQFSYAHERPQHEVFIDAYWIDIFEVSNAKFSHFVDQTGYETQAEKQGYSYMYNAQGEWDTFKGVNWRHPMGAGSIYYDELPVTHVNYYDALAYCSWVGGRLPTEAEWEKAARGDDGRIYPWGNDFYPAYLQSDGNSGPTNVDRFPEGASPYGIFNMAGNVFEWTSDWYGPDYYEYSPGENPQGPSEGEFKAIRGGAWTNSAKHVRTPHRDISMPDRMNHLLGFRCVMSP